MTPSGPAQLAPVPTVSGPDELGTVLDLARTVVPAGQDAVVVLPTWGPPRQREVWESARTLLRDRRLLLVDTALPPLAAQLLAETLAGLAVHVERLEELALAAGSVEAGVVSAAWVSSVTGLAHVDVPMSLHVRSYVARRGFVVRVRPEQQVLPVGREGAAASLPLPQQATVLVASDDAEALGQVGAVGGAAAAGTLGATGSETGAVVRDLLGGRSARRVEPPPGTATWWGCERVVEVAAVSADLVSLAVAARSGAASCRWCGGTATSGQPCPRCGAAADGNTATVPTRQEPAQSGAKARGTAAAVDPAHAAPEEDVE